MSKEYFRNLKYIYWAKEADFILLNKQEYDRKIAFYKKNGTPIEFKTDRFLWMASKNAFREDTSGKYAQLYTFEKERLKQGFSGFVRYSTNTLESGKVINKGRDAYNAVVNKIKELTGEGRDCMCKLFGHAPEIIKKCVPKQFYHINEKFTFRELYNVSGVDFCSHYPSSICGRLPDANKQITVAGTVAPSEEYPFAFYTKSGHIAELGVFDTHNWLESDYAYRLFSSKKDWDSDVTVKPEKDQTILMPAASFELTEIMQYFFDRRKEDDIAKLVMNAYIGYLHRNDSKNYSKNPYAHLAAVCIARANEKMLRLAEKIGYEKVIQICVDGCMYLGGKEFGCYEKKMGLLEQEFTSKVLYLEKTNLYIVEDEFGNNIKFKLQGYNYFKGEPISEDFIPKKEDLKYLTSKRRIKNDKETEGEI